MRSSASTGPSARSAWATSRRHVARYGVVGVVLIVVGVVVNSSSVVTIYKRCIVVIRLIRMGSKLVKHYVAMVVAVAMTLVVVV